MPQLLVWANIKGIPYGVWSTAYVCICGSAWICDKITSTGCVFPGSMQCDRLTHLRSTSVLRTMHVSTEYSCLLVARSRWFVDRSYTTGHGLRYALSSTLIRWYGGVLVLASWSPICGDAPARVSMRMYSVHSSVI